MIRSIADLFHPHDPAAIDTAIRERTWLHLSTDRAAAFARLLPWDVFNMLPRAEMLLDSDLRVVQRGRDALFDQLAPRHRIGGERSLSPRVLHDLCEQGMSMVLNDVGRHVPRIAALGAMVERQFRGATQVNCYASFRRESAFRAHFDAHDVIVLQLQGSKTWHCHGQPHRFPLDRQRFPVAEELGPAEADVLMQPGDLLYLPRGEVHWAETVSEASLHLTIAIQQPRAADLLSWLAAAAEREQIGREDLDGGEGQGDRLRAMLYDLADGLDVDAFHAAMDQRLPLPAINLGHMQELREATLVMPALRRRVMPDGLSEGERAVLRLLLERDSATIGELVQANAEARDAVASLARKSLVFLFAD